MNDRRRARESIVRAHHHQRNRFAKVNFVSALRLVEMRDGLGNSEDVAFLKLRELEPGPNLREQIGDLSVCDAARSKLVPLELLAGKLTCRDNPRPNGGATFAA